jgi:2-aminophenol/2-amino-5-chlorophenol 1,6-dioxygenase beta subunit
VPNPHGLSVEPIFPHLLRYRYDFRTDVELAEAIVDEADAAGLVASRMTDPGVRVDYATIGALHLLNPDWDIPVVSLSANNNPYYYSEAGLDDMEVLGEATRRAIERTGRRAVLAASNSLSHLHWDTEPELPEDMAREHPYNNHQYQWDMRLLELIRSGRTRDLRTLIPEHIAQTAAEIKAGSLSWMLAAMGWPEIPGDVLGYWTVIGTGNAVPCPPSSTRSSPTRRRSSPGGSGICRSAFSKRARPSPARRCPSARPCGRTSWRSSPRSRRPRPRRASSGPTSTRPASPASTATAGPPPSPS